MKKKRMEAYGEKNWWKWLNNTRFWFAFRWDFIKMNIKNSYFFNFSLCWFRFYLIKFGFKKTYKTIFTFWILFKTRFKLKKLCATFSRFSIFALYSIKFLCQKQHWHFIQWIQQALILYNFKVCKTRPRAVIWKLSSDNTLHDLLGRCFEYLHFPPFSKQAFKCFLELKFCMNCTYSWNILHAILK